MSKRIDLFECLALSESANASKVDREAGVIRGVKILGWSSLNGREYDPTGVNPAIYEGRVVNFNHHKGSGDRSAYDRFGRVVNVVKHQDGLYGDLEYLKSHPYASVVAEAAERMPSLYGLSHTARGQEGRSNRGKARIESVVSVQSVDLVSDPATVAGLYESKGGGMKTVTVKEIQESLKSKRPGYVKALTEMAEAGIMGPADTMPEPPAEPMEGGAASDHKQAILDAVVACIHDESLDLKGKWAKMKKLMKLAHDEEAGGMEGESESESDDETETETETETEMTDDESEVDVKTKKESVSLAAKLARLEARDRLRTAADEHNVKLPKTLLESVRHDITEADAKALVAELKGSTPTSPTAQKPQSAAPITPTQKTNGRATVGVSESGKAKSGGPESTDPKVVAKWLNGR